MVHFESGLWNAWLLSLPFLMATICVIGANKGLSRRMSDMTGYRSGEKCVTVFASLASYPLMIVTIWLPFTTVPLLLYPGLLFYCSGFVFYAASLRVMMKTPLDKPFTEGPYRFSRNPLYVSATAVFTGICLATASVMLAAYLVLAVLLQHFMILAEERVCREKYGIAFEGYIKKVPRYLLV